MSKPSPRNKLHLEDLMKVSKASLALTVLVSGCAPTASIDDTQLSLTGLTMTSAEQACTTLTTADGIDAGSVCIAATADAFVVTVVVADGWTLGDAQMWMGTDLADMPTAGGGNPDIDLFPYASGTLDEQVSYTFTVPFSDLGEACNQTLLAAVHVTLVGEGGTESGWASGEQINEGQSSFFDLTYECNQPAPAPEPGPACETAFAYGDTSFVELGITLARWGWEIGPFEAGSFSTPLYAGAGRNDLGHGTEVGMLNVQYDGATLVVEYVLAADYDLQETHLYAGASTVSTTAPGQFGNTHEELSGSGDTFTLTGLTGEPLYLVAHAVVCGGDLGSESDDSADADNSSVEDLQEQPVD